MFLKFSVLQMTYWCGYGAFAAFLIPYLNSQGFMSADVGIVMAIYTLVAMGGQLLYGRISDYIQSIKPIYMINHFLIVTCILGIYFIQRDLKPYLVCLLGFVQLPMPVLLDSWIIKYYHETPEKYAPIRSFGSLAYAFFSFVFGYLVESIGFAAMPIFSVSLFCISFVVSTMIKESHIEKINHEKNVTFNLIREKRFLILLVVTLLLGLSAGTIMNMQSYIIYGVNGKESSIGICMSISAFAQVPIMMFYSKIKAKSIIKTMVISMLLYISSFVLMLFSRNVTLVYLAMVFYGMGFGLFLPSIREYVGVNISRDIQTTSLSILDACQNSVGSSIGIFIGGMLIEKYTDKGMVFMCLICSVIALFMLLMINDKNRIKNVL